MKRLSLFILFFSLTFTIFFIGPPLLSTQCILYPLMKRGDVLDLLTPLVLIALYWVLFCVKSKEMPGFKETLVFLVLAALWVEGQGMHLSANSIGHLLKGMENSNVYALTYFYDEVLSHYFWHFGIVGLSALLIFRQWKNPFADERAPLWMLILAGIIHGFTIFLIVVEAGTAPLGVSFAVLAVIFALVWGRKKFGQQPLLTFFFVSYAVAVLFFAGWAIYWRGLPQFSEVGLL